MDPSLRQRSWRVGVKYFLVATASVLLSSCSAEGPTERTIRDEVHHVDLVVAHLIGPALSQERDTVSVVRDKSREVIFEGYGGSSVVIKPLTKDVLVLAYCGGVIEATHSFLVTDQRSGQASAVKVQPVVVEGLKIGGVDMCGGTNPPTRPDAKQAIGSHVRN
jgi:hypothetical protein